MRHRVLISGVTGKMGCEVVRAVDAEADMQVVGGVARRAVGEDVGTAAGLPPLGVFTGSNLWEEVKGCRPDVLVDFTSPDAVWEHASLAAKAAIPMVIGTSGLSDAQLSELDRACRERGIGAVVAPNFAVGAVLMAHFAGLAALHFPSVEIVEYHHDEKKDAPSGTALLTAAQIAAAKKARVEVAAGPPQNGTSKGLAHQAEDLALADAPHGVPVHSVRLPGFVAHQEVIFGAPGQRLTIRHDTTNRESFMPGVLLSIRKVAELEGVVRGLEPLIL